MEFNDTVQSEDLDFDDLLVIEDIDIGDEAELRQVIAEVEALVGAPGKGLRVSVLTAEQWETVLQRRLPRQLRRGAEHHFHVLSDPVDPQHLLISPSAVRGINEGSQHIYQEVVYTALRCIPTNLSRPLRKGLDDLLAEECGRRIGVELFVRTYPRESELVRGILSVLTVDFDYQLLDWGILLRKNPERVLKAFTKTKFAQRWPQRIATEGFELKTTTLSLVKLLTADPMPFKDPLVLLTEQMITEYLIEGAKKT